MNPHEKLKLLAPKLGYGRSLLVKLYSLQYAQKNRILQKKISYQSENHHQNSHQKISSSLFLPKHQLKKNNPIFSPKQCYGLKSL